MLPGTSPWHLKGFAFPPGEDPMQSEQQFRTVLQQRTYMPWKRDRGSKDAYLRFETNLRVILEAVFHFAEFWGQSDFWSRLRSSLDFHPNTSGENLRDIVDKYCAGRAACRISLQASGRPSAPPSRLAELADDIDSLRVTSEARISPTRWDQRASLWKNRLTSALGDQGVLAQQVRAGTCAPVLREDVPLEGSHYSPSIPTSPRESKHEIRRRDSYQRSDSLPSRVSQDASRRETDSSTEHKVRGLAHRREETAPEHRSAGLPAKCDFNEQRIVDHPQTEVDQPDTQNPSRKRARADSPTTLDSEKVAKRPATNSNNSIVSKGPSSKKAPNQPKSISPGSQTPVGAPLSSSAELARESETSYTAGKAVVSPQATDNNGQNNALGENTTQSTSKKKDEEEHVYKGIDKIVTSLDEKASILATGHLADQAQSLGGNDIKVLNEPQSRANTEPASLPGVSSTQPQSSTRGSIGLDIERPLQQNHITLLETEIRVLRERLELNKSKGEIVTLEASIRNALKEQPKSNSQDSRQSLIPGEASDSNLKEDIHALKSTLKDIQIQHKELIDDRPRLRHLEAQSRDIKLELDRELLSKQRLVLMEEAVSDLQRQTARNTSDGQRIPKLESKLSDLTTKIPQLDQMSDRFQSELKSVREQCFQHTTVLVATNNQRIMDFETQLNEMRRLLEQNRGTSVATNEAQVADLQRQVSALKAQLREQAATPKVQSSPSPIDLMAASASGDIRGFLQGVVAEVDRLRAAVKANLDGGAEDDAKDALQDISFELSRVLGVSKSRLNRL
ncbi:hypothetical protein BX600DRAFT_436177 [Xylariales sp. PMI_506]|nr:hypothetical protein BX600DRAFT_436177 [Xylariales sp. PMI_506]